MMNKRSYKKLICEGSYIAEVDVELLESGEGWSPYLSIDDAYKLDNVRDALRRGDIGQASKLARIFSKTPVNA
jgi:hypothetical protein